MSTIKSDVEKLVQKELESLAVFRSKYGDYLISEKDFKPENLSKERAETTFFEMDYSNAEYAMKFVRNSAVDIAYYAIRVAAMAQKFINSQKEREKSEGN